MNGIETRAAYIRRRLMTLYNEHLADKMIPTSNRFLVYELVQKGVIDKKPTGILKPGAKMQRRTDQEVIDALTWLREHDQIPWSAIVDETRSYDDFTGWRSIAEGLDRYLEVLRLDPWNGKPPPLTLTESRSLAGVLRVLVRKYCAIIVPTNGQVNGFLRTEIAPLLRDGQNVLYLGDLDKGGGDIEANTRRVLERERPDCTLLWERLALTPKQVVRYRVPGVIKTDGRFKKNTAAGTYEAWETEALSQKVIVKIVERRLNQLLPQPLKNVLEREELERARLRELLRGAP
jgi:hypothetical protein